MKQLVEILPDHFFRAVAGHFQQSIVAERHVPFHVQTAETLDDGIQDEL